jgi:hypothetical protein
MKEILCRQNPSFPSPRSDLLLDGSAGMIARECSGEQIRSFPQSALTTVVLHAHIITWGMNNRPDGGHSSETQSHLNMITTTTIISTSYVENM